MDNQSENRLGDQGGSLGRKSQSIPEASEKDSSSSKKKRERGRSINKNVSLNSQLDTVEEKDKRSPQTSPIQRKSDQLESASSSSHASISPAKEKAGVTRKAPESELVSSGTPGVTRRSSLQQPRRAGSIDRRRSSTRDHASHKRASYSDPPGTLSSKNPTSDWSIYSNDNNSEASCDSIEHEAASNTVDRTDPDLPETIVGILLRKSIDPSRNKDLHQVVNAKSHWKKRICRLQGCVITMQRDATAAKPPGNSRKPSLAQSVDGSAGRKSSRMLFGTMGPSLGEAKKNGGTSSSSLLGVTESGEQLNTDQSLERPKLAKMKHLRGSWDNLKIQAGAKITGSQGPSPDSPFGKSRANNLEVYTISAVIDLGNFRENVFLIDVKDPRGVSETILLRAAKSQSSKDWVDLIKESLQRLKHSA